MRWNPAGDFIIFFTFSKTFILSNILKSENSKQVKVLYDYNECLSRCPIPLQFCGLIVMCRGYLSLVCLVPGCSHVFEITNILWNLSKHSSVLIES